MTIKAIQERVKILLNRIEPDKQFKIGEKLRGGLKNSVYSLIDKSRITKYILKVYGRKRDEFGFSTYENESATLRTLDRIGIEYVPKLYALEESIPLIIISKKEGLTLGELLVKETNRRQTYLSKAVEYLAHFHEVCSTKKSTFQHKLFKREPETAIPSGLKMLTRGGVLSGREETTLGKFRDNLISYLKKEEKEIIHGCLFTSNLLIKPESLDLSLIDFELTSIGPIGIDLGLLLNRSLATGPEKLRLLKRYADIRNKDVEDLLTSVDYNSIFLGILMLGLYKDYSKRTGDDEKTRKIKDRIRSTKRCLETLKCKDKEISDGIEMILELI